MESKQVVMRASLQGMVSKLLKLSLFLLVVLMVWRRLRRFQAGVFETYDVSYLSALTNALETDIAVTEMVMLVASYFFMAGLAALFLYLFYQLLFLISYLTGTTIIDFDHNRIIEKRYLFPFQRIEDENAFHQIIQVRIEQNLLDRMAKGGNLYVEYLVLSKLDSQLRVLEIPYILEPERAKRKLL